MSRRTAPTPHGPSPEALRQQLQKANLRIAELEALNAAHRANTKTSPSPLLVEIAATLEAAAQAANPIQAMTLDPDPVTRSTSPPDPGAATRAARKAANRFTNDLHRALDTYNSARRRNFAPYRTTSTAAEIPLVRCRRRDCQALDIWMPAWKDIRGQKRIYAERCMSCGELLTTDVPQPARIMNHES